MFILSETVKDSVLGPDMMTVQANFAPHSTSNHYGHWFMFRLLRFPFSSLLVAWESSRGRPKAFGPCTHMGDLEEDPGSWLWIQIRSALAIAATWGVNQQMQDLSVSPSLCRSVFSIKINKSLKTSPSSTGQVNM